ncbi:hypothetical protein KFE98_10430 [bacterium SCSIO 12741]|nr:hypothetical protein KFE98_10430 [bacterium SCSIO 12741]
MMTEPEVLDSDFTTSSERRRKLLPLWIKIFLWIFMVFGFIAPAGFILGLLGMEFNLALYGFETTDPLSLIGLMVIGLFAIKGAVSFGLWTEKNWAVNLAMVDAVLGIAICTVSMIILPFMFPTLGFEFTVRLELVALIPYLIKMMRIRDEWSQRG